MRRPHSVFQIEATLRREEEESDALDSQRRATSGGSDDAPARRTAASVTSEVRAKRKIGQTDRHVHTYRAIKT